MVNCSIAGVSSCISSNHAHALSGRAESRLHGRGVELELTMSEGKFTVPLIESDEALMETMTRPSQQVTDAVSAIEGDVLILGGGGKMGPAIAEMLVRAGKEKVIGVDLFPNPGPQEYLDGIGVQTVKCDLMDGTAVASLPDAPNVLLMVGFKFGATGNPALTWGVNSFLPAKLMERYPDSRTVYVSSGNVYKFTPIGPGAKETDDLDPIGEYAMSRLAGERLVEFCAEHNNTPTCIARLFYATELRYGIIWDVATKIKDGQPIDVSMGHVNQIWQGDAAGYFLQLFPQCQVPARVINMTGLEVLAIRDVATKLGDLMGVEPIIEGEESDTALLGDSSELAELCGPPPTPIDNVIEWVAWWVLNDMTALGKPTKYERRDGKF